MTSGGALFSLVFFTYSHSNPILTFDKRELESILEPDLRQIAELEAEIERERRRLEKDEDFYEKLNQNAVDRERIRRQQVRSVSSLDLLGLTVAGLMCCGCRCIHL